MSSCQMGNMVLQSYTELGSNRIFSLFTSCDMSFARESWPVHFSVLCAIHLQNQGPAWHW
jgi:hypothetical protein